jgi:hypothetical protein
MTICNILPKPEEAPVINTVLFIGERKCHKVIRSRCTNCPMTTSCNYHKLTAIFIFIRHGCCVTTCRKSEFCQRGFCPSCGLRRLVETSAHLVDHVIPKAPVRQWVLSFPWPLRLPFARQPDTLSRCLAVIIRAIDTDLVHRAGLTRTSGAQTIIVTLIQRFGSVLNLNIHLHMIALDGVYAVGKSDQTKFHRVKAPNQTELRTLLNRVIQRVVRKLEREDLLNPDPEQSWLDLGFHEPLDSLSAASIR